MYTFKHVDKFSKVTIEMTLENEGIDLDTLLEQFENFLRASGFGWIEPDSIQWMKDLKGKSHNLVISELGVKNSKTINGVEKKYDSSKFVVGL